MKTNRSILIIDDVPEIGEFMTDLLSDEYEKVKFISVPEEAREVIKTEKFDLILSDVNMPGIPGPELMKFVRAQGQLIPIIFVTAFASKEVILDALRLGVADVIEKPVNNEVLLDSIKKVLEMEKRKLEIYQEMFTGVEAGKIDKHKKMYGLLQVANTNNKKVPA